MKEIYTTLVFFLMVLNSGYSQTSKEIFKNNPPSKSPAIFISSMPPCIIGVAKQYGKYIGVTENTIVKTDFYIKEAMKKVPEIKKQVRIIEIDLMKASRNQNYKKYEKLLHELSDVKIKASLFHEELVKKARKDFNKEDIKKLDKFINTNKDEFLKVFKL